MTLDDPRYRAYHVLTLAAIPLVQLGADPTLFVNPGGNTSIDPWVYTGFFVSLPTHIQRFGGTYYANRLAWILPGFAAHRLLPPLAANYALHLTFFYVLLAATYALVARAVNRSAAMFAALLMAWQPVIIGALGWDYVDGAGIVYLVVVLLCLESATGPRHALLWSFAAGMAGACVIVTNLTLVLLTPAFMVFVWMRAGPGRRAAVVARTLAVGAVGAAMMLMIFALVYRSLGGSWWFLEASVRISRQLYGRPTPWTRSFLAFPWARASWLALPVTAAIGALASLVARPPGRSSFARAVQVTLLLAIAAFLTSDLAAHTSLLQYPYYATYLAPFALLALPLQAATPPWTDRLRVAVAFELLTLATLGAVHLLLTSSFGGFWSIVLSRLHVTQGTARMAFSASIAMAAGLAAVSALRLIRPAPQAWAAFTVAVACSYVALPPLWSVGVDGRDEFQDTVRAHRFITGHLDNHVIRFWTCAPTGSSPPFLSISSTYLWGYVLINEQLPALTDTQAATLQPGARLVLLVNRPTEADEARNALRPFGLDFGVIAQQEFGAPRRPFRVVIADLVRRPAA
jgi:hypothetical protein